MAILFHNIKSGERRLCRTEPMIAAHYNTSDRNPNAHQGQDMGWRLSPKTVVEMERIMNSPQEMSQIAASFGVPVDSVSQTDVLNWISRQFDKSNQGAEDKKEDFERRYRDDIRRLQDEQNSRDRQIVREATKTGGPIPQRIKDAQAASETVSETTVDFKDMTRPQLNEYADGLGIGGAENFNNKDELIKAIESKED